LSGSIRPALATNLSEGIGRKFAMSKEAWFLSKQDEGARSAVTFLTHFHQSSSRRVSFDRMKVVASAVAMAVVIGAGSAWANEAKPDDVRRLLAVADTPASASEWRELGEGVDARLIDAASDQALPLESRIRAVDALRTIPTSRAIRFLRHALSKGSAEPELIAAALQASSEIMASTDTGEALHLDEKFIDHPQWIVREAAARALGRLGTPEAEEILRHRWSKEKAGVVKLALSAALIDAHRHR
jgi:HEAT repeat protein